MKCISEEKLQHYIDNELAEYEMIEIRSHLESCSDCFEKREELAQRAMLVKNLLHGVNHDRIIIPEFKRAVKKRKKEKSFKSWVLDLAVASVIIFMLGFFISNEQQAEDEFILRYGYDTEFDANLPLGEQEITITFLKEDS